ncbi:Calmodulin-binding transcription activator 2 [Platanthera guangdongensis]|uniref:Calmodulin-binding transcription activator 2 n=1 Tax=Platanthera guangdongensis TaxID=2320717 RepID=A0ABR2MBE3_9ASPA
MVIRPVKRRRAIDKEVVDEGTAIVKAHVRGHQVRKQYKRVVWSVGIVEKVMLRWRQKGSGLRGFWADKMTNGPEQEKERTDEYEFLGFGRKQKVAGIEKALSRVKSMSRYPEARDQYMRLVMHANNSNVADLDRSCSDLDLQPCGKQRHTVCVAKVFSCSGDRKLMFVGNFSVVYLESRRSLCESFDEGDHHIEVAVDSIMCTTPYSQSGGPPSKRGTRYDETVMR